MASTLSDFHNKLGCFYKERKDENVKSLQTLLSETTSYFFSEYDDVAEAEFVPVHYKSHLRAAEKKSQLRADLKNQIDSVNALVTEACTYGTLNGKSKLYSFFFQPDGKLSNKNYAIKLGRGKFFFRMRGSEAYKLYNRMELFQIKDVDIKLVGKQRFNQDGIPCLYLAESLYCAWEEVRRKDFEKVNFCCFKNTKDLRVLDLTIKPVLRRIEDFFLAYLALLVSGKVADGDAHKFQYDVSNLLMDVLQASIAKGGNIDGIKYMSSRRYDGMELAIADTSRMYGYVFPLKGENTDGVDKWMKSTFVLTEPRTSFMYDIHLINFDRTREAITSSYQDTLFYMLEEQLKKEEFKSCGNE